MSTLKLNSDSDIIFSIDAKNCHLMVAMYLIFSRIDNRIKIYSKIDKISLPQ